MIDQEIVNKQMEMFDYWFKDRTDKVDCWRSLVEALLKCEYKESVINAYSEMVLIKLQEEITESENKLKKFQS